MDKKWSDMSSNERRKKRFERWLAAEHVEFINPEARQKYEARLTRYIKAITLEIPDRVPVSVNPGLGPATYAGYTIKDVMYDMGKVEDAWTRYATEVELDFLPNPTARCRLERCPHRA